MSPVELVPCPLVDACGACTELRVSAEQQAARKLEVVSRAVGRAPDGFVASPRALGYRARVRMKVGPDGRLGYHQPRSHALVTVPMCAIARPEINAVLAAMPPLPPELEAVELRSDGERVLWLGTPPRRAAPGLGERVAAAGLEGVAGLQGAVLGGRLLFGEPRTRLEVAGVKHEVSATAFSQVNLEVNALLVEAVRREVARIQPSAVLDLYAGYGNLSLPLAAGGVKLTLIEENGAALADARRTAARLGCAVDARQGDAGRFRAGDAFFDVALLDPPREGAPGVLEQILVTRPAAVIYVSCNVSALARDLRPLLRAGYRWARLEVYDMFPQTAHVEALAVLHRPGVCP